MGSPAVHFDPKVLKAISEGADAGPKPEFKHWATALNSMAEDVEQRWSLLSAEQQRVLVAVFSVRSRPEPLHKRILQIIMAPVALVVMPFVESAAARREMSTAVRRLAMAVKEAQERHNPDYEARTVTAVNSVLSGDRPHGAMTPGEFRDWLTNLPDRPK